MPTVIEDTTTEKETSNKDRVVHLSCSACYPLHSSDYVIFLCGGLSGAGELISIGQFKGDENHDFCEECREEAKTHRYNCPVIWQA